MGEWVWDGGRPSVDLLNTIRDRTHGGRETLRTVADLTAWLAEAEVSETGMSQAGVSQAGVSEAGVSQAGVSHVGKSATGEPAAAVGEADLDAFRRLRTAIDVLAVPAAPSRMAEPDHDETGAERLSHRGRALDAVAIINAAAGAPVAPRLGLDDDGRPVAMRPERPASAALARIAMDAIDLLTGGELVRVCAADDCGIRFVDRSPARNRQWCSMRRCGNRTKARRHYARARG
jgi:predicted RNA-binding Zn ribbon-like protein